MVKFVLLVAAVAALQCAAVPLNLMGAKNLPAPSQDHEGTEAAGAYEKSTPGESCISFNSCDECTVTSVCVWVPHKQGCFESRDRIRMKGTRDCASPYTSEIVPDTDDELDDFTTVDVNVQTNTAIAALKSGEDVFATADDADGPRGFAVGGLDYEHAAPAGEYDGGVRESDEDFEARSSSPGASKEDKEPRYERLEKMAAEEESDEGDAGAEEQEAPDEKEAAEAEEEDEDDEDEEAEEEEAEKVAGEDADNAPEEAAEEAANGEEPEAAEDGADSDNADAVADSDNADAEAEAENAEATGAESSGNSDEADAAAATSAPVF